MRQIYYIKKGDFQMRFVNTEKGSYTSSVMLNTDGSYHSTAYFTDKATRRTRKLAESTIKRRRRA